MRSEHRFLLRLFRGNYVALLLALVSVVISSAIGLSEPLLMGTLIDRIVPAGDVTLLIAAGLMLLLLHAVRIAASSAASVVTFRVSHLMTLRLRAKLLRTVFALPYSKISVTATGEHFMSITDDAEQLCMSAITILSQAVGTLSNVVFMLIAMRFLNTWFLLLLLPVNVAFVLLGRNINTALGAMTRAVRDKKGHAASLLQEYLNGAFQLRVLRSEKRLSLLLMRAQCASIRAERARRNVELAFGARSMGIGSVGTVLILIIGCHQVMLGGMSLGGVIAAHGLLTQMFGVFTVAIDIVAQFAKLSAIALRLSDVLTDSAKEDEADRRLHLKGKGQGMTVSTTSLSFEYAGHNRVLSDLTLTLAAGERIAIAGPSGCGKSTLARILACEQAPTTGQLLFDGVKSHLVDRRSLRQSICFVPQDSVVFSTSLKDNLLLANPNASDAEIRQAIEDAMLLPVVEKLEHGEHTQLGSRGALLSGGERQRVALARAFLQNPSLLILDEATSALDHETEDAVYAKLAARQCQCTVVIITHRLTAVGWVDRVVHLPTVA